MGGRCGSFRAALGPPPPQTPTSNGAARPPAGPRSYPIRHAARGSRPAGGAVVSAFFGASSRVVSWAGLAGDAVWRNASGGVRGLFVGDLPRRQPPGQELAKKSARNSGEAKHTASPWAQNAELGVDGPESMVGPKRRRAIR